MELKALNLKLINTIPVMKVVMVNLEDHFGSHLRLARTLKGWTQQELGVEISASRQYVHQLESGLRQPSNEIFEALCEALRLNAVFFQRSINNELTADKCHFRKRKTTKQSLAAQVAAFGTIFEEFVSLLLEYIDFPESEALNILEELSASHPEGEYSKETIELVSEKFRLKLGLGLDTPIDNVTDILESLGVFLTTYNGISDKVDALSFSKKFHVVIRNTAKESACRQRFDLSHELGHLILHQGIITGEGSTEPEADYFASSFLFPRKAFIREFPFCLTVAGSFRWKDILLLKKRWKVSQRAIIYRAHSLGLINARQYRNANVHLSSSGQSKKEDLDDLIPLEIPKMISATLDLLKNNAGIGFDKLAETIGFEPEYLATMIGLDYKEDERNNISPLPIRSIS
jgi:Zn-dependent peptidase ImmA (M78 family)/transcriptional regulator with XRE-family HTH domain